MQKKMAYQYSLKRTPIKKKPYKASGEGILFETILNTRKHISFVSGVIIHYADHNNCAHVLSKAQNKYPAFKLCDFNIVLLTKKEHFLFDQGTLEQREAYAEECLKVGLICNWKKLYDLVDELKLKYKGL